VQQPAGRLLHHERRQLRARLFVLRSDHDL
jgi:hypothetical protein